MTTKKPASSFAEGVKAIKAQVLTAPETPGVYRMLDDGGKPLYVGKAKNLKKRIASYAMDARLTQRLRRMVALTRSMELVVTHTEAEALLLEANLVRQLQPRYNVLLRDDKSFPYILIPRDHDFPPIVKHRGARARKGWYFGPFASGAAVTDTLLLLQRGFMLRNCPDSFYSARRRPCLQYHIKRCTAPCVGKVSKEDYAAQVQEAVDFLGGRNSDIQQRLAEQMQQASAALNYEQAARLRDRIRILTGIQSRQDINVAGIGDADIIAAHREAGQIAMQLFFFRSDRNFGTRSYFPRHDPAAEIGEVMAAFLAQFYADKPITPALLLSHAPEHAAVLAEALAGKSGHAVDIQVPARGARKRLIDMASENAKAALARRMAESATQWKFLQEVGEIFDLPEAPKRIEVYDNSHIQGSHAVGAMIVAGPEGLDKKAYRKFTMRGGRKDRDAPVESRNQPGFTEHQTQARLDPPAFAAGDDFAMMREMLSRRLRRLLEEDPDRQQGQWPDLLLVDGGQGQLNSVLDVLHELGIDNIAVVAIAKGADRHAGREKFYMPGRESFSLPPEHPALYYLQNLRDEAHRFAIGAHRGKRAKAISASPLDAIQGIGAARKRALLHHFGSARAVAQAGISDLGNAPGISAAMAQKIYRYFH